MLHRTNVRATSAGAVASVARRRCDLPEQGEAGELAGVTRTRQVWLLSACIRMNESLLRSHTLTGSSILLFCAIPFCTTMHTIASVTAVWFNVACMLTAFYLGRSVHVNASVVYVPVQSSRALRRTSCVPPDT